MERKTITVRVANTRLGTGTVRTQWACSYLVEQSVWFECEPVPDGGYEIRVKEELRGTPLLQGLGRLLNLELNL